MINILIVEDQELSADLLKYHIERYFDSNAIKKFRIDTASNGWEAIGMMSVHRYEIVFLDVIMPKYDGYAVINTIRKTKKDGYQPYICMVTCLADKEAISLFKSEGANSYVIKPFDGNIIVKILDTYIHETFEHIQKSKKTKNDRLTLDDIIIKEDLINYNFIDFYDEPL